MMTKIYNSAPGRKASLARQEQLVRALPESRLLTFSNHRLRITNRGESGRTPSHLIFALTPTKQRIGAPMKQDTFPNIPCGPAGASVWAIFIRASANLPPPAKSLARRGLGVFVAHQSQITSYQSRLAG